ncbi:hypothetical protein DFP72DRAFT_249880 [Ephemerocybe angulata]|uniref:UBZ3-type domain-containing protein n=1 Tax=Ephemerocybe angulata TaxID=980116 RepID=A0A8H6I1J4_9AGAR|nr:hypothetical protein DFP72DRAFT_249880 [Tulosesus angulatus]
MSRSIQVKLEHKRASIDQPEVSKEDVDNQMEDPQARSRSGTDELSYTCPRCQKTIRPNAASSTTVQTEEECETVLTGLRLEHDDWHFAQDLVREGGNIQWKADYSRPNNPG